MGKPLAGRRAFEAMGRRARSQGLSIATGRSIRTTWPDWARSAWAAGWIMQAPKFKPAAMSGETKGGKA